MEQRPIYDISNADAVTAAECRYDVLPLKDPQIYRAERFCLAQTLNLARQRQQGRPLPSRLEIDLQASRNWAVEILAKHR